MSLEIKLEAFEGPMDLLMLLIEKNKVDIYNIPISLITDQYLQYVESIEQENPDLDTLSDFLVMAVTLLDIKARMLLPKEEDENGEEIDPRTELVERLIEYQEFKFRAKQLMDIYDVPESPFYKEPTVPDEVMRFRPDIDYADLLAGVTMDRLSSIFRMVMEKQEEKTDPIRSGFREVRREPVRLSDKLLRIMDFGKNRSRFSFRELLERSSSRADLVVTFLACLELIKIGQIEVSQEEIFGDIEFIWNENCETTLSKEEIADYD